MLQLALALPLFVQTADTAPQETSVTSSVAAAEESSAATPPYAFPAATGPLRIEPAPDGEPMSVEALVKAYADLTKQSVTYSTETKVAMGNTEVHVESPIEVPASGVQTVFESFLVRHGFCLGVLEADGVRVLEIMSQKGSDRPHLRSAAHFIDESDLEIAAAHPAMIFSTVITLRHADARQLANSMRAMITDANTQQMMPAGGSNSIVLIGFGDRMATFAQSLQIIDRAASIGAAERAIEHHVIVLENATAVELAELLVRVLRIDPEGPGTTRIFADPRSNSLIVSARKGDLAEIKMLIANLDR